MASLGSAARPALAALPGLLAQAEPRVATACTEGRTEHRRAALFFATEHAFRDSAGYGCLRVTEKA